MTSYSYAWPHANLQCTYKVALLYVIHVLLLMKCCCPICVQNELSSFWTLLMYISDSNLNINVLTFKCVCVQSIFVFFITEKNTSDVSLLRAWSSHLTNCWCVFERGGGGVRPTSVRKNHDKLQTKTAMQSDTTTLTGYATCK